MSNRPSPISQESSDVTRRPRLVYFRPRLRRHRRAPDAGNDSRVGAGSRARRRRGRAADRRRDGALYWELGRDPDRDGQSIHHRRGRERRRRRPVGNRARAGTADGERDRCHRVRQEPRAEIRDPGLQHHALDRARDHARRREHARHDGRHGRPVRNAGFGQEAGGRRNRDAHGSWRRRWRLADERCHRLHAEAAVSAADAGRGSRRLHAAHGLPARAGRVRSGRHQPGHHRIRRQRPHVCQRVDRLHDGRRTPRASTSR